MQFKSYYTRVFYILSSVFVVLFLILGSIISLLLKKEVIDTLTQVQQVRVIPIFKKLDQLATLPNADARVQEFIDQLIIEMQIDVYDSSGMWIAGNNLYLDPALTLSDAREKTAQQFTGFSSIFENPTPNAPYQAVKISWYSPEKIILKSFIKLLALAGIITFLVAVGVGWVLAHYLTVRLQELQRAVGAVARGDFDVALDIRGDDEIADLGRSFTRMARQLKDLVGKLADSNAARERLIAHASHEIRSPLTSIKGFVDIVDYMNVFSGQKASQHQQLLTTVRKDIQRVIKVTDDLVQLARLKEPHYQFQWEKIDLIAFLAEEHRFFVNRAIKQDARATLILPKLKKFEMYCDPMRLAQILDNLWGNALKYGNRNQPVETHLKILANVIQIEVSNHLLQPLDVPPEQLVEPFYRHPSVSEKIRGSGLGLAIVSELVEKMGGSVSAKSDEKKLVVFFQLPILKTKPQIPSEAENMAAT